MAVTIHSPVLNLDVGDTYSGAAEPWLVANGYAEDNAHAKTIGPSNTGKLGVDPKDDLTLADNREDPGEDFKLSGELAAPELLSVGAITPATGPAAGGTVVTIKGDNLKDVTGVTFGGNAGTSLSSKKDSSFKVTTPAHAAGAVNVVVTDPDGSATKTGGFTYS